MISDLLALTQRELIPVFAAADPADRKQDRCRDPAAPRQPPTARQHFTEQGHSELFSPAPEATDRLKLMFLD